jgi:hypothetical protein
MDFKKLTQITNYPRPDAAKRAWTENIKKSICLTIQNEDVLFGYTEMLKIRDLHRARTDNYHEVYAGKQVFLSCPSPLYLYASYQCQVLGKEQRFQFTWNNPRLLVESPILSCPCWLLDLGVFLNI